MPLLAEDPGEAFPNPIIARLLLAATFPENVVKLAVSSREDVYFLSTLFRRPLRMTAHHTRE